MKFTWNIFKEAKNKEKLLEILKQDVCNSCLGRSFGMLGHGLTNKERGEISRSYASSILEKELKEPDVCELCNNFFKDGINKVAKDIAKKLQGFEFNTFLIGSIISDEAAKKQDELWGKIGIEDVESIKSEVNRELGKRVEKLTKKRFDLKNPDVTILADLKTNIIRTQIRSLYVFGGYQKLARGIPQAKWICRKCGGKGCTYCKGEGKLYKTSVQEIIEKPLLKATDSKKSSFSGAGREDIDARCLDYRPFVIELIKPVKRKIDLRKIEKQINKSKKAKVRGLKMVEFGKEFIKRLKTERIDKTYLAEVEFKKPIDKKKLKLLKQLINEPILQKTPLRVVHRRADKFRKRSVKKISWKLIERKKLQLKVRTESGLYIKELISGDEERTKPNVAELIENKVKKISLDVIKIHAKKLF